MNLLTKYSFVAIESHIDAIAMDEYLLKSNRGGDAGRKLTGGNEVIQKNSNTLNNKGNKMENNETTNIEQDLNLDIAEHQLQNILEIGKDDPRGLLFYELLDFALILDNEIYRLATQVEEIKYFKHLREFNAQIAIQKAKSFCLKVFKLAIDHIKTDAHIQDCRDNLSSVYIMMYADFYILLLAKVLNIRPQTPLLDNLLGDLYMSERSVTHSEVERISCMLNYPIPLIVGDVLRLHTER